MPEVKTLIPALAIARPIQPLLEDPTLAARVIASFDRSCYLETLEVWGPAAGREAGAGQEASGGQEDAHGRVIAVLHDSLGRGAFALTVGGGLSFVTLPAGAPVRGAGRYLHVGEVTIDLTPAAPWDPMLPPLTGPPGRGMHAIRVFLRRSAPQEGLARAVEEQDHGPLLAEARRALRELGAGLAGGGAGAVTKGVTRLAGLGPGLTPSGDDVLAGFLLALRLWPHGAGPLGAEAVTRLVVDAAAPRTGRISRAYLEAAGQGHAPPAWHDLVRGLPQDPRGAVAAAARILKTGETSGADMLAGFVFGWRAAAEGEPPPPA